MHHNLSIFFCFSPGEDGISTLHAERPVTKSIYTLSGLKVENGKHLSKGVYIRGGKKVVVK